MKEELQYQVSILPTFFNSTSKGEGQPRVMKATRFTAPKSMFVETSHRPLRLRLAHNNCNIACSHTSIYLQGGFMLSHQAQAASNFSFNAAILSSSSHISSSVRVFFFLPSLIFFSKSLICFLASFALTAALALRSILLPAPS